MVVLRTRNTGLEVFGLARALYCLQRAEIAANDGEAVVDGRYHGGEVVRSL